MNGPPDDLFLTLVAHGVGERLRARLSQGPERLPLADDEIPPGATERVATLMGPLQAFPDAVVPESALTGLGLALAEVAVPPGVRAGLSIALAGTPGPLRLRLAATREDLAGLPWEFLHLGEASDQVLSGFLGLHPRLRLTREPPNGKPPPNGSPAGPVAGPVRVLLAHADPGTPEYPSLPHIGAEVRAVAAALNAPECRRAEVRSCDVTPAGLRRALQEWAPHVLHLIGHGDVLPTGGVLVLQGERDGQAALVYADELAEWLRGTPVRLVVLSACRTGAPDGNVARHLSAAGVPVVVAMQLPLRDAAAGPFSRAFYAAMLEPCGVEEALSQARQAVRGMGADWGVPILYQAGPSVPLFGTAPTALPPTNLPYRPSDAFVGRDGMMAELHRVLSREGRSTALIGMSGLGKTQLAAEYAHAHRGDYPGGVFWVGARATRALRDDLAALGRRFFGAPEDLPAEEAAAMARDALERRPGPTLLVADDVGPGADLRLLPPTGSCRLLLTAQEGYLAPHGVGMFFLPVLEETDALTLLGAGGAAPAEREAASAIVALLGGLPLALALVAGHVARLGLSFREYHDRLSAAPFETLDQARRRPRTATGHAGAVSDALALSFQGLTPSAQGILSAAAALGPYRITPDLLFETWGGPSWSEFEEAVGDLVDGTLVTRADDRRLTVHELMRTFAREQVTGPARAAGVARAASALTRRMAAAVAAGTLTTVRHEAAHAEAVAAQCRALGLDGTLVPLLLVMGQAACEAGGFGLARAHFDEGLSRLRSQGPDGAEAAPFLRERAAVRFYLGETRESLADATAALALARRAFGRNVPALAEYYTQVGLSLRHLNRFHRARVFYDRALALTDAAYGRRHSLAAECLNNLGTLREFQGDLNAALEYQVEALAIFQDVLGPRATDMGVSLNNLGRLLGNLGRWAEALARHEEALALYLAAYETSYGRRHPDIARSLFYRAEALCALGRGADARADYEEALTLYEHFYGPANARCDRVREGLAQCVVAPPGTIPT